MKKEEEVLKAKLKNVNPPKLTVASTFGGEAIVIDIQIAGFAAAAAADAA